MATDAFVGLELLRVVKLQQIEREVEPYIWPMLIRVDDVTLATDEKVVVSAPPLNNARIIIEESMRPGDSAAIPPQVGVLGTRFEDNLATRRLILVVALFEADDTPAAAARAGYEEFLARVRAEVVENLLALATLKGAELEDLIEAIQARVTSRIRSAISDALTPWQKAKVAAGAISLDDPIDGVFTAFGEEGLVAKPFLLVFELVREILGVDLTQRYEIEGRLVLRPVTVDPCKRLVDAVRVAQQAVDEIEKQIQEKRDLLGEASPVEKEILQLEITELEDHDLPPAEAELASAMAALAKCRSRLPPRPPGGVLTNA